MSLVNRVVCDTCCSVIQKPEDATTRYVGGWKMKFCSDECGRRMSAAAYFQGWQQDLFDNDSDKQMSLALS